MSEASAVRELLASRRYVLYLVSRVSLIVASQMMSVAVGWQVYEITGEALALGFSGLAIFLPGFLLALPGGYVADRVDRRSILLLCYLGMIACATTLSLLARGGVDRSCRSTPSSWSSARSGRSAAPRVKR